jgi:hypothetical protein
VTLQEVEVEPRSTVRASEPAEDETEESSHVVAETIHGEQDGIGVRIFGDRRNSKSSSFLRGDQFIDARERLERRDEAL